jgi:hypothetical protein
MKVRRQFRRVFLLALCGLGVVPSLAAALEFDSAGNGFELLNASDQAETRAGAHPDRLVQEIRLVHTESSDDAKEVVFDLPAGMDGSSNAVPLCPRSQFGELPFSEEECPEETRIGTFYPNDKESLPLFDVEPGPNELAVFGARRALLPVKFVASLRPADQGLSLRLSDLPQNLYREGKIELWGVPADHQKGTSIPRRALLTTPTRCEGRPLTETISANSWQQPQAWTSISLDNGHPLTDCGALPFAPAIDFSLGDARPDTPTGATVEVRIPQDEDPAGRASSMIRDLAVTMPAGVTVAPGGAAGIAACSDAQFGRGSEEAPSCPASARVGSVQLSPAGGGKPLSGSIFVGEEHPDDRFRVLVAASAPGSVVKFSGSLDVDSQTGRVTVDLQGLPQAAFESLSLSFKGGLRSLLATPLACGAAPVSARFTPYSGGSAVDWNSSVSIGRGGTGRCGPQPFAPSFVGGSLTSSAGRATAFSTAVRRQDGEQLPVAMTIALPRGLSAALGRVKTCRGNLAESGGCPAGSRIGAARAELGPGEHPAHIDGDVYLTGPYRGAPFGIDLVFDAKVGPFDLGRLVVRGSLEVDLNSGQVKVQLASLPTVFEGLPIRFQTIGLDLNRPGFMFNPTACGDKSVTASLRSRAGSEAMPSTPFIVHGCIDLPFRPGLSVALGTASQLRAGGHPSLRMAMKMPPRNANLRSVAVRLPTVLKLDPSGIAELCSRRRAMEGRCPRKARIGTASARTSLLARPMKGVLYLVQPDGSGPPDIWANVRGQGLEINLRAKTGIHDGQLETRFLDLPDVPMRSLVLRLRPGDGSVLKLRRRPCGTLFAPARISGQNGAVAEIRWRIKVPSSCARHG